jgi:hypothetical protein
VSRSDIDLCREAILSLPQTWVLANIESKTKKLVINEFVKEEAKVLHQIRLDNPLFGLSIFSLLPSALCLLPRPHEKRGS